MTEQKGIYSEFIQKSG